jgi:hypothetical protein
VLVVTFRGTFGGFRSSAASATPRRPPSCFSHRSRVLVGANRAPGRLMRCESKQPGKGEYWKVLLDSGEWIWPDNIVLATPGERVGVCEMGEGRFMTDQQGDGLLCPKHDEEAFGTAEDRAIDAADARLLPRGNSTKWKRGKRR